MDNVLAGNLCSLLATATDAYGSSRKTARGMLIMQSVSQVLLGASSAFLGGYSAVVQNAVSIVRNLAAISNRSSRPVELVLIILGVVLGIVFNNLGLIGWMPIVGNLGYSVAVFRYKDNERLLKVAFCGCIVLYAVFNLCISNYVGSVSNLVVLAVTVFALIKGKR